MPTTNPDDRATTYVPTRPITRGPQYHWFGYYDKLQFSPSGRYVLSMEVDFEGRSPRPSDRIGLGMIDLEDDDRWIPLAESSAWCWQQGCMLQWLPGSENQIIYNDRSPDGLCSRILNVHTGESRKIPIPVYALSPDGSTAVSLDFFRTGWLRPGYGYAGEDPHREEPASGEQGVYCVDLNTGDVRQIITLADLAAIPCANQDNSGRHHWVNHLLISPDGARFILLHRWSRPDRGGIEGTRMCTANLDGTDLRVLHDGGQFSHFIWQGSDRILAWADRPEAGPAVYSIDEQTGEATVLNPDLLPRDGHLSVLPGDEWILNDSYPRGPEPARRGQPLYLYHIPTDRRIDLGVFPSPPRYTGEYRCDLHPRLSRDGRRVTIDSPHGGEGRQVYLLDIGEIIEA